MAQDSKKISFGFSKSIKKHDLKPIIQNEMKKVDYIDYVDNKSIKVIGKEEVIEKPLVIPMLGSKTWHDRIINKINADIYGTTNNDIHKNGNIKKINTDKQLSNINNVHNTTSIFVKEEKIKDENREKSNNSTVTLEELAANEIIQDLQEDDVKKEPNIDISIEQSQNLIGEKEPTLENYEEIPIEKFGVALLRGMGWEPEKGIGKNSKVVSVTLPNLRPRGMGLGADKVISQKQNVKPKSKEEQELKLEIGCYIRVLAGKYINYYGELEGFDDDTGRLIVKLALGNKCVSLNEYLIEPVIKEEYIKNSKVLNISSYEKFSNKLDSKCILNSSDAEEIIKRNEKNEKNVHYKESSDKKTSKYHDKLYTSSDSSDSDNKYKQKYKLNDKDDYYKSKKLKKYRCHNDSVLSRKNSKKDKERERIRDRSKSYYSNKSSDKKKYKKHKRSHSRSLDK